MTAEQPLLDLRNLRVDFRTASGTVHAVRELSLTLGRERLGIVGESGSGKSMTGRAILDLVPRPGVVAADRMTFRGQDLLAMGKRARRGLRGRHISMVMQDPRFSLNPVKSVGSQVAEAFRVHHRAAPREAKARTLAVFEEVHIREAGRVYDLYPHEVSGGMGQRVMIAMMVISQPDILIADEPTSALDATVQVQVLKVLDELVARRGMGLIFISHDLRLVQSFCDRVIVMFDGKVMEQVPAAELADPSARAMRHPYTLGLLDCMPSIDHQPAVLPVLNRNPSWSS